MRQNSIVENDVFDNSSEFETSREQLLTELLKRVQYGNQDDRRFSGAPKKTDYIKTRVRAALTS